MPQGRACYAMFVTHHGMQSIRAAEKDELGELEEPERVTRFENQNADSRKLLKILEPARGLEPPTYALRMRRSTC